MAFDKKGWIVDRAAAMYKRQDQYAARVKHLYDNAVERLLALATQTDIPIEGDPFSFSDNPRISQEATAIIRQLYSQVYQQIKMGVEAEWDQANEVNDKLIKYIFGSKAKKNNLAQWFERNRQAQDAFFARSQAVGGMNLSQRVWKYTSSLRPELETAISVSIGEGVSASTMSRRVRQYLREPDKLFRRVRGADGKLRLSKAAQAYHPGRGVYRSSYKNAMRLTRTETNAAYRTADELRWRNLPFVVGYEVKTSNNHPEPDICDDLKGKYPKDFKYTAWHPHCRCYVVPILCSQDEMADLQRKIIKGEDVSRWRSKSQVDVPPQGFVNWVRDNQDRIEAAATKPYFIANNKGLVVKIWNGEPLAPEPPEAKLAQQGKKMLTDARAAIKGLQSDALDNRFTALESAISSGADPAEVMRLYERVLQGAATQRKWDAQVWAGFTAEQKANLQELEKLLGIRKGRPMTHAQADEGRTNPLYNNPANKGKRYYKVTKSGRLVKNPAWDDQYSVNCQTTVPTYLLRRWGFNVEALGNKKGDVWKKLGGGYTNVWKNKKGEIGFGLRFQETTTRTVNMFDWLSQQPDGIYQVQCTWKGGKSGHTWCYVKENGKGFMYDPQNNKVFKNMAEFKEYSQNVSPKYGYHYFRIDDLRINNGAMSKMVQQYTERIDSVEAARIKRHATRDADAIKQAWRNRLRDNLAKDITAEAMKSDAARARLKAFENAVKADDAAAIRREYYRAKQGLQVQKQWTEQRKALAAIENEANTIKAKVAGYKEVDTTKLDNLMRYRLHKAEEEINKLKLQNAAIEIVKNDIKDLLPDADKWLSQFTAEELKQVHQAVNTRMARMSTNLKSLEKELEAEVQWVEDHKKYKTWAVAQDAYKHKLAAVRKQIEREDIKLDIDADLRMASKSAKTKKIKDEFEALYSDTTTDLPTLRRKAQELKDAVKDVKEREDIKRNLDSLISMVASSRSKPAKDLLAVFMDEYNKPDIDIAALRAKAHDFKVYAEKLNKRRSPKARVATAQNRETLDELKARMGSNTPKTLPNLGKAQSKYARGRNYGAFAKAHEQEIEEVMRDLFDQHDLGMHVNDHILELIEKDGRFKNTFETGTSGGYTGSSSTTGKIPVGHGRLDAAHKLFGLGSDLANDQLARAEYEKYGNLLDRDIHRSLKDGNPARQYGNCEVRFKKDKVVCTWTAGDSLGCTYQPSLVSDPKAMSFDAMGDRGWKSPPLRGADVTDMGKFRNRYINSYLELQFHGEVTVECIESIAFPYDLLNSSAGSKYLSMAKRFKARGVKIYYMGDDGALHQL